MILYLRGLPVWRWYWRASFMAASVASEPPLSSFTAVTPSGARRSSSWVSSSAGGDQPGAARLGEDQGILGERLHLHEVEEQRRNDIGVAHGDLRAPLAIR